VVGITEAARHWQLADVRPIADTPGSLVYRARQADGRPVIAKLLKPRGMGELPGMDYLAWRHGLGAVTLLAREGNACLLEDAGTRTLEDLRRMEGEAAATAIFAAVLRQLHAPAPMSFPGGLIPLEQHFTALLQGRISMPAAHETNVAWAASVARALLMEQTDVMPLHGDLHHENILADAAEHWRAIDPHGLIGDPAYDAANFFGNPLGRPDITCDEGRIRLLANLLAPALDCSEGKILRYAAAHSALSACWSIGDPASADDLQDAQDRLAFLAVVRMVLDRNSP
jgi:streptomycin 6-kinase